MAELFSVTGTTKEKKYQSLFVAIAALVESETDIIANMANITAAVKEVFDFLWVGFYRVVDDELVLGPFQGAIACTRIKKGRGVCGVSWEKAESIIVPDVNKFAGHIACSSKSKSEIVIPLFKNGEIIGVLDIDSEYLNTFDETDEKYLSQIVNNSSFLIRTKYNNKYE
ncbi:MAG: GAF domain-containing protein [Prevotellaceae bacterium]|jgi:GAF domain-containing protein|nr:GAF domain-containing protein [Prevotellaceae bacterium]